MRPETKESRTPIETHPADYINTYWDSMAKSEYPVETELKLTNLRFRDHPIDGEDRDTYTITMGDYLSALDLADMLGEAQGAGIVYGSGVWEGETEPSSTITILATAAIVNELIGKLAAFLPHEELAHVTRQTETQFRTRYFYLKNWR